MADSTARSLLGALIMSPGLITASDELCSELFGGRNRIIFDAIDKLWNESQPEQIELPLLIDRLGDKVPPAYVSALLDGVPRIQPDGFVSLVNELAKQKIAKSILKIVKDGEQEIVKTGEVDLTALKPLILKYESIGDKERRMSEDIRLWVFTTTGEFSLPMAYRELGAKTTQEQGLVRVVLHGLVKSGDVIPVGKGYGHYRKADKTLEEVDLLGVAPTPIDLYLPLGLDHAVKVYPKSIVVFAGSSNQGKTTMTYDFIKGNHIKHNVHLFFSEGGQESLRDRLDKHLDIHISQWQFKAYPRTSNFADVIFPNDINVIDYLLVPDEFWRVSTYLDEIYRKLDRGMAYVNIQKGAKSEVGRGGDFGLERPQLYVTLTKDEDVQNRFDDKQYVIAKVLKAKAWKRGNPDGKACHFSIQDGWRIEIEQDWHYPAKKSSRVDSGYNYNRR